MTLKVRAHFQKWTAKRKVELMLRIMKGEPPELIFARSRILSSSLVAVNLETGRRNQIRVHFAEMGDPTLGDLRYEANRASHPNWPYKRLALHARMLGFSHPVTRRELRFESELPEEFKTFSRRFS
jgi:23S rRNA pseudouridine1911/1915/1917 synthase